MGTMSYCCMQNTNIDMKTCLEKMNDLRSLDELESDERRHAAALYNKCSLFVEEYERLRDASKE